VLESLVGHSVEDEDDEEHVPWMGTPEEFVEWMSRDHKAPPMLGVLDLHDSQYTDLRKFNHPKIGTDGGQLTGWRVAEHVVMPLMLDGGIRCPTPLIMVSSKDDALGRAREEAAHSEVAHKFQTAGYSIAFLHKPQRNDDLDARAFRRTVVNLAKKRITREGLFEDPLFELGIDPKNFDHLAFLNGIQKLWGLTDIEMAALLLFERPDEYAAFRSGSFRPTTRHWRRHSELLFGLKSRLSGLKRQSSYAERAQYDQLWLKKKRPALDNHSPLEILLKGDMKKLDMLIAFLEGVEIERSYWSGPSST
jgi:hypothetical protein